MTFVQIRCCVCGSDAYERELTQDLERRIVRCDQCDVAYVNPQPDAAYLDAIYAKGYFTGGTSEAGYTDYQNIGEVLRSMARHNLAMIAQFATPGSVLDVGAATGEFLDEARKAGWKPSAVELSPEGREACQDKGFEVLGASLAAMSSSSTFDLVTYWDVLEHVVDPRAELCGVHAVLSDGGLFATTMPNYGSLRSRWEKGRWWAFFTSREHLWFFSPDSLSKLLQDTGFEVLHVETSTIDLVVSPVGLFKDVLKRRFWLSHQSRTPSIDYHPAPGGWRRRLERRNVGHVLFLVARRVSRAGSS